MGHMLSLAFPLLHFLLLSCLLPWAALLGCAWVFRWRWVGLFERALSRMAKRRALSVAFVGLFALAVGMAVSLLARMPQPFVHDEFSYLLAADTFAQGRLSNPTHPLWIHFESFHILQQPTYASKYPPAQGMVLAAGQILTGFPAAGLWLSDGLACAALCWMLMAWIPPRWALLGGLLAPLHPIVLAWSQCYWGGAVAMAGGALVLGAVRRLMEDARGRDGIVLGLGVALLANSRPYEGLVLTLIALSALIFGWIRSKIGRSPTFFARFRRAGLPFLAVMALNGLWMGYYNARVTGSPFLMPYTLHEATYIFFPILLWQHFRPMPMYHHAEMRGVYLAMSEYARQEQTPEGWIRDSMDKGKILSLAALHLLDLSFYRTLRVNPANLPARLFGFSPILAFAALPWALRKDPWTRFCLAGLLVFLAMLSFDVWIYPHYAAPAVGLLTILCLQSLRVLRGWKWRGRAVGRGLTRQLLIIYVLSFFVCVVQISHPGKVFPISPRDPIAARLNRLPGRHLVVVRYAPTHDGNTELVYNRADIDAAKIVWAREMDGPHNRQLLSYFHNRHAWLLEADAEPPRLTPYSGR